MKNIVQPRMGGSRLWNSRHGAKPAPMRCASAGRRLVTRVIAIGPGPSSNSQGNLGPSQQVPQQPMRQAPQQAGVARPQQPQQAGMGGAQKMRGPQQPNPQASTAMVRRGPAPQSVYLEQSQVLGKQVITCNTGRSLGVASFMWIDPNKAEVVSLDLTEKKGGSGVRSANIPLSMLSQIGDVILVDDESALYQQPLDGRYGYLVLTGMEVKTRSGDFLGKVRDFSFSPDTGLISRIVYDDFGLSFLPVNFFDTYSISLSNVLSFSAGGIVVSDESRYMEQRESSGLFALIPSLLRSIGSSSPAGSPMLSLTNGYRGGGSSSLPDGYSYEQWEADVRRWEQETGLSYNQYVAGQGGLSPQQRSLGAGPAAPQQRLGPAGPAPAYQQQPSAGRAQQQYPSYAPQQRTRQDSQWPSSPQYPVGPSPSGSPYQPQPSPQPDYRPRGYPSSTSNQPGQQGGYQPQRYPTGGSSQEGPGRPSSAQRGNSQTSMSAAAASSSPASNESTGRSYDSWAASSPQKEYLPQDGWNSSSAATTEVPKASSSWSGYYRN